jgi:hypothetical protein
MRVGRTSVFEMAIMLCEYRSHWRGGVMAHEAAAEAKSVISQRALKS